MTDTKIKTEEKLPVGNFDVKKANPFKFTFVNQTYQALKNVTEFTQSRRFYNTKAFFKKPLAVFGTVILVSLILLAVFGPLFTHDPYVRNPDIKHKSPGFVHGGRSYVLGTDQNGADLFARVIHGLRYSMGLAAAATLIDIVVGVVMGLLMGYFKNVDKYAQFFIKIASNIPMLFIMTLVILIWSPSFWILVLGITILGWIPMAQIIRAQTMQLKRLEFTQASEVAGSKTWRIIKSYIPHLVPMIITQLVMTIPGAILADASLGMLGLAVPNVASLGSVMSVAQQTMIAFPLEVVWPISLIVLVIFSVQLIGSGIQDVLVKGR